MDDDWYNVVRLIRAQTLGSVGWNGAYTNRELLAFEDRHKVPQALSSTLFTGVQPADSLLQVVQGETNQDEECDAGHQDHACV